MELLDVVNENGEPTGEVIERGVAHEKGILHRTSHVWIARIVEEKPQIMLQKRSKEKDSYPGCYDISSAGHIQAGTDFGESAIRELEEELGIKVSEEDLIQCGYRRIQFEEEFHGKKFIDNQYSRVYLLWYDCDLDALKLQKEEVEEVIWMDFEECCQKVRENAFPNCIIMEELDLIRKYI